MDASLLEKNKGAFVCDEGRFGSSSFHSASTHFYSLQYFNFQLRQFQLSPKTSQPYHQKFPRPFRERVE